MENTLPLTLTERAAARILAMRQIENKPHLRLRLRVDSGGCSGFSYVFDFSDEGTADDVIIRLGDAELAVDPTSLPLLSGSVVDYVEEMIGSYFAVKNPNAGSSCGCGTSFSL
jgi:iron-sulfur cluster insertion protein